MAAYLEHMALRVKEFDWHVQFFQEVFDMPVRLAMGEAPNRKIWLHAGIQFNEDVNFNNEEGRSDHLGIMVEDVEAAVQKALERGAKQMPQGDNWFMLPSGICVEVIGCKGELLEQINALGLDLWK